MAKEKKENTKNTLSILQRESDEEMKVLGKKFIILKNVFSPKVFPSTGWYAKALNKEIKNSKSFLEIGCGSGLISVYIGTKNKNIDIVSTDINNSAIKNAKLNLKNYSLENRTKVIKSNLFRNLPKKKFDLIFWAMPFGFLPKGRKLSILEKSVFDPGYKSIKEFIKNSPNYLNKNGRILIGFSKDIGDVNLLKEICNKNNLNPRLVSKNYIYEGKRKLDVRIYELITI